MGLIGRILGAGRAAGGVGAAVTGVAEVFVGNRAEREANDHAAFAAAVGQHAAEFAHPASGWFDGFVDGLNRLPRPLLALGTLALFGYAMAEPVGFGARMQGLALVPEPLWWLLGAVVSFYFGARELHYRRAAPTRPAAVRGAVGPAPVAEADAAAPARLAAVPDVAADADDNPALEEWRRLRA